jgi:ketosteroid isomerase-like protein
MKTITFITLSLFFFSVCASPEPVKMSLQEQETAKKEIREVVNVILQNLQKMDAEALFQSYSDASALIFLTTDGSKIGLEEAKNHHSAWFNSLSSLKVTTITDDFRFLPGNNVVCSWIGKFEMTLGSGQQLKIDKFGITFIFSKIDNEWKVIYQHSSALPPTQ